jgi:hypothetical protein
MKAIVPIVVAGLGVIGDRLIERASAVGMVATFNFRVVPTFDFSMVATFKFSMVATFNFSIVAFCSFSVVFATFYFSMVATIMLARTNESAVMRVGENWLRRSKHHSESDNKVYDTLGSEHFLFNTKEMLRRCFEKGRT